MDASPSQNPPHDGPPRDSIDVSNDDEADFEYEVEPADEEVTANQLKLARSELKRAQAAVDVDAIYREMDNRDSFDAALEGFKARFSIKSLLIAMTVVAIVLGVGGTQLLTGSSFAVFIVVSLVGLGATHTWLNYQDHRRREALIAKRQRELRRARGEKIDVDTPDESVAGGGLKVDFASWMASMMRFSTGDLLIAMALAAGMVVFMEIADSPIGAAAAMGTLAILGFAMQAGDMNVPKPAILAWWIALVGYCVLTVISLPFGGVG
ncbi:MAG: hypothetical protein AAF266_08155 [Planctomycetota bacterium]